MTPFQWISVWVFAGLLFLEAFCALRGLNHSRFRLVRCLTWIAAATAIAFPATTNVVAACLGIQRGADLVSYLGILTFLGFSFFGYSRYVRLQGQITALVRKLAILEAERSQADDRPARDTTPICQ